MKKTIILSLTLMLLFACDKKETLPNLIFSDNIITGKSEGTGIKYSGSINDTLFFDYPTSKTSQFIDINNDGKNDFELIFSGSASPGHRNSNNSIASIGNSFIATPDLEDNIVDTLPINFIVNQKLNWINDTCVLYNYYWDASGAYTSTGCWNNVRNKYIGTKIIVDDNVLYGWLKIEITYAWNLTLIDYACTVGYEQ